jgi:hypothetical protein
MLVLLDPFARVKSATTRVVLRLIWRLALLGVAVLVATAVALVAWRLTALWGLPNPSEPFDTAAFRAPEVVPERDAFVLYPLAAERFKPFASQDWFNRLRAAVPRGWQIADKDIRSWLAENREALDLWRQAAECPEASLRQPSMSLFTGPSYLGLFWLAQLQASRLEVEGDMAGALEWHRACLRMIRHFEEYAPLHYAGHVQREIYPIVLAGVQRWADDPRVDAPLQRLALDDAQALNRWPARASDALKLEYLSIMRTLSDPPPELVERAWNDLRSDGDDTLWYRHIPLFHDSRWFIRNEPERSRRVARLVYANWLAHCERPASRWRSGTLLLLNVGGGTGAPATPLGLSPADLSQWYDSTLFLRHLLNNAVHGGVDSYQSYLVRRSTNQAKLILTLAEQLYAREHGGRLPASPRDLVGPYLRTLPEDDLDSAVTGPSQP